MYVCIHACMYVCMHVCMDGWMDGWMCVCIYTCIYIYIYIHTHTHIYTHTVNRVEQRPHPTNKHISEITVERCSFAIVLDGDFREFFVCGVGVFFYALVKSQCAMTTNDSLNINTYMAEIGPTLLS